MAELTCSFYLIKDDNTTYPIDKLSDAEKAVMSERLGRVMSNYYTQRPNEYEKVRG